MINTGVDAGEVTIADGTALADFTAFIAAADAVFAIGRTVDDAYMAFNAFGTGNGYLAIDEDNSGTFDAGDTLVILTGVNLATEFVLADIV